MSFAVLLDIETKLVFNSKVSKQEKKTINGWS